MAAFAALGPGQLLDFDKVRLLDPLDDELRDAITARQPKRVSRVMVDQRHPDLPAVAGVDRAGRVDDRDAVLRGEPRSWLHERGVPIGERDGQTRAHCLPLPRRELDIGRRHQIGTSVTGMRTRRHRNAGVQPAYEHWDSFRWHVPGHYLRSNRP